MQLEHSLDEPDLDGRQLRVLYRALVVLHQQRFATGPADRIELPPTDDPRHDGGQEAE